MPQNHPRFIDWAITSKCNLNCIHCRGMAEGELSTQKAREVINAIVALRPGWVIIEGGEPLLRDDLFELMRLLQRNQIQTHLVTNGTLLTTPAIHMLKSLDARIMISLDGATASTYESIRGGARFNEVIEKARQCAAAGLLEAINFTMMKSNYLEIPGLFEIARDIGVKQITFIGYKPCHGNNESALNAEESVKAIQLACENSRKTGIGFFFDEPFFCAVVKEKGYAASMPEQNTGILDSSTTACIFGEYLFIDCNGDVKPCSYAPLVLGNVHRENLATIWKEMKTNQILNKINNLKHRTGHCSRCRHIKDCGGCRSRTFMLTGDWFASDPNCPLSAISN